jgi:hypothetical protein
MDAENADKARDSFFLDFRGELVETIWWFWALGFMDGIVDSDNTRLEFINDLTERILGAAFEVSNTLGCGFLEKIYERGLLEELRLRGIRVAAQVSGYLQGSVSGGLFCGFGGGRGDSCRVEMRGPAGAGACGAVPKSAAGFWTFPLFAVEF